MKTIPVTPGENLPDFGPYIVTDKFSEGAAAHVGPDITQIITTRRYKMGFMDRMVELSREDAIELGKAILTRYQVPFCNRIKGVPEPGPSSQIHRTPDVLAGIDEAA